MATKQFIRGQILHHIVHFGVSIPFILYIHPLFVLGLSCGLELAQHWTVVEWFLRGEARADPLGWWKLFPEIAWIDLVADLVSWNIFTVILVVSGYY